MPADPRVWGWLHRRLRLPERALLLLYRGLMFYGLGRLVAWFLHARLDARTPLQLAWGGPAYVTGNDLSDAGVLEVAVRTAVGGVLFAAFLWLFWKALGRRLWDRGYPVPAAAGRGGRGRRSGPEGGRGGGPGERAVQRSCTPD